MIEVADAFCPLRALSSIMASICSLAQSISAFNRGNKDCPRDVNEYSTFGGIWA